MSSIMRLTRIPKLGWCRLQLLCGGGADVKMISALPTALHSDQPDGAGHFFNRRRGCLSNRVSRSGAGPSMVLKLKNQRYPSFAVSLLCSGEGVAGVTTRGARERGGRGAHTPAPVPSRAARSASAASPTSDDAPNRQLRIAPQTKSRLHSRARKPQRARRGHRGRPSQRLSGSLRPRSVRASSSLAGTFVDSLITPTID